MGSDWMPFDLCRVHLPLPFLRSNTGPVMVLKFKEHNTLIVFYSPFFVVRDTVAENQRIQRVALRDVKFRKTL